jgi:hypothetical protein
LDDAAALRLPGVAAAGDRIVLRRGAPLRTDRASAIRTATGVTLHLALFSERTLVLLPAHGASEAATLRLLPGQSVGDLVAGTQVLLLRA